MDTRIVSSQAHDFMPLHRHENARVVLVLDGEIVEQAFSGSRRLVAGEFVFRPPHFAHSNTTCDRGVRYIRLAVSARGLRKQLGENGWGVSFGRVSLSPFFVKKLRENPFGGDRLLGELLDGGTHRSAFEELDAIVDLALDLEKNENPGLRLGDRAIALGLRNYELTRKFKARFGINPASYRREVRLQMALRMIFETDERLAGIAFDTGFSDQSHLTRSVRAATGHSPAAVRRKLRSC